MVYILDNYNDYHHHYNLQGLFAAANIFSSLKLVYIFSVNPYLGPLQVSTKVIKSIPSFAASRAQLVALFCHTSAHFTFV